MKKLSDKMKDKSFMIMCGCTLIGILFMGIGVYLDTQHQINAITMMVLVGYLCGLYANYTHTKSDNPNSTS